MTVRRLSTYEFALRFVAPQKADIARILAYPMVKTILDTIDANVGAIFVIQGSPQLFKTLIAQLHALRSMMIDPASALWYGVNEPTAEGMAIEKLNPLYDACMPTVTLPGKTAPTQFLLFAEKNKRTTTRYELPSDNYLLFLSAGPDINRQSKSVETLYLDEPWEYDPGWIKEIERRREDFVRFQELHMQTGPTAGSFSESLWEQSSRFVWHMRCTSCKGMIPPEVGDGKRPGGLRYESGPSVRDKEGTRIMSATRATVHLECPHCETRFPDSDYSREQLNAGGMWVATNPNPEFHIFGFRCPKLPLRPWGEIVAEKIIAQRALRRGETSLKEDYIRKTEAKTFDPKDLLGAQKLRPIGQYKMGSEWEEEEKDEYGRPWRFATIDVQQDYYVLVIRMWGKWSRSRLRWVSKPKSITEINDTLALHGVMRERVFLDARFEPTRVRRVAVQNNWKTLMGDKNQRDYLHHFDGIRRIYDEAKMIDAFAGTEDATRYPVCVEILFSKNSALNRVHLLRTENCNPDPLKPAYVEPIWTAAEDAPLWYWQEIDAHSQTQKAHKDGSESTVWVGQKNDHSADCEAMQVVVASMAGLTGVETSAQPKAEDKPAA